MLRLKFNVAFLNTWLEQNRPLAKVKLSKKARYSVPAIYKLQKTAHIPKARNLNALADAMGTRAENLILKVYSQGRRRSA